MDLRLNESEATARIRNAQKCLGNADTSTEKPRGGKKVLCDEVPWKSSASSSMAKESNSMD